MYILNIYNYLLSAKRIKKTFIFVSVVLVLTSFCFYPRKCINEFIFNLILCILSSVLGAFLTITAVEKYTQTKIIEENKLFYKLLKNNFNNFKSSLIRALNVGIDSDAFEYDDILIKELMELRNKKFQFNVKYEKRLKSDFRELQEKIKAMNDSFKKINNSLLIYQECVPLLDELSNNFNIVANIYLDDLTDEKYKLTSYEKFFNTLFEFCYVFLNELEKLDNKLINNKKL